MKCPTYLTFWNCRPSEPIIHHSVPDQAWTKTDVDPFYLCGHYYLLMIDYYFRFIVTKMLKNLQTSTVINKFISHNLGLQRS